MLARNGINFDGSIPDGLPFTTDVDAGSYRAAYTYEPIPDLMFYSMYATAYDPAAAGIFSLTPGTSLQLTSSRIYETGAKQLFWDDKAEWTVSLYDIVQRNVYVRSTRRQRSRRRSRHQRHRSRGRRQSDSMAGSSGATLL